MGGRQNDVLSRVSLEVERGELVTIEGKRSSGKSTLLHVMAGLQPPDSGQVFLEGLDLTQLDEEQLAQVRVDRVGFLFEAFNLLLDDTVLTNVEVPLQTMGMDPADSRIKAQDALQVVGLGYQIEHVVGKLSAGFRQLVALARALVNDPTIILADEPTRDLDNDSKEQAMGIFQKINEAGMTIVLSTDDSRTSSYCSRVVKMNNGSARDEGVNKRQRIVPSEKIRGMRYIRVDLEEDQVVWIAEGAQPDTVVVDLTSGNPPHTASICDRLNAKGIRYIDAGVSGGLPGAEAATLGIMIGGDGDVFEQVRPVLEKIGTNLFHMGPIGAGPMVKALNNFVSAASLTATLEALSVATKAGLDPEKVMGVINASSGRSRNSEERIPKHVLTGDYNFRGGMAIELLVKDLATACGVGKDQEVPMFIGNLMHQLLMRISDEIGPKTTNIAAAQAFEKWAGVDMRAPGHRTS